MLTKEEQIRRRKQLNRRNFASEAWFEKILNLNGIRGYRRNVCLLARYFGDFVFRKTKTVVEIDGSSHNGKEEKDAEKDLALRQHGYQVLRIKFGDRAQSNEVLKILKKKQEIRRVSPKKKKQLEKELKTFNQLHKNYKKRPKRKGSGKRIGKQGIRELLANDAIKSQIEAILISKREENEHQGRAEDIHC